MVLQRLFSPAGTGYVDHSGRVPWLHGRLPLHSRGGEGSACTADGCNRGSHRLVLLRRRVGHCPLCFGNVSVRTPSQDLVKFGLERRRHELFVAFSVCICLNPALTASALRPLSAGKLLGKWRHANLGLARCPYTGRVGGKQNGGWQFLALHRCCYTDLPRRPLSCPATILHVADPTVPWRDLILFVSAASMAD